MFLLLLSIREREYGSWRVRTNAFLEELVAQLNIIGGTKGHRHRVYWIGHSERIGEDRNEKTDWVRLDEDLSVALGNAGATLWSGHVPTLSH